MALFQEVMVVVFVVVVVIIIYAGPKTMELTTFPGPNY